MMNFRGARSVLSAVLHAFGITDHWHSFHGFQVGEKGRKRIKKETEGERERGRVGERSQIDNSSVPRSRLLRH